MKVTDNLSTDPLIHLRDMQPGDCYVRSGRPSMLVYNPLLGVRYELELRTGNCLVAKNYENEIVMPLLNAELLLRGVSPK